MLPNMLSSAELPQPHGMEISECAASALTPFAQHGCSQHSTLQSTSTSTRAHF
jgi:hypothetical protein